MEWQLSATNLEPVRRWLSGHDPLQGATPRGLMLEPLPTLLLADTYLDTADWRIYHAGFALRIRLGSGRPEATLKAFHSASPHVADRLELNEPLETAAIGSIAASPGHVGNRVRALAGTRSLRALFEVRTRRERFAVNREGGSCQLGEIALDETTVFRPGGSAHARIQRVEVEALTDDHEPLRELVALLRGSCALEPASGSKFSAGLKIAGLIPPGPAPNRATD